MTGPRKSICLGIAGGSGSGKSGLAHAIARRLGRRAVVLCQDWYYRDKSNLPIAEIRKLNVDHPSAIENTLLRSQLDSLMAGQTVHAPRYDYATHARLKDARMIKPAPLVIVEGLLVLEDQGLRDRMDASVYIEVPDDLRLMRRIRRDVEHRRVALEETLRLYERFVRPMHQKFVQPSSAHATWVWRQLEDRSFPPKLIENLRKRLDGR